MPDSRNWQLDEVITRTTGPILFILHIMQNEKTYVFVPGGWHGGWAYDPITNKLGQLGKKSISLTLPGLEAQPGMQDKIINLDTHIQFEAFAVFKLLVQ
ncbi:hypothetical protein SAMN05216311_110328 [Chitinophaga sp. CF418]|nr:hypothetical protein SAMN05216311_110328 [Chitinophaga sp. CF418]